MRKDKDFLQGAVSLEIDQCYNMVSGIVEDDRILIIPEDYRLYSDEDLAIVEQYIRLTEFNNFNELITLLGAAVVRLDRAISRL